MDDKKREAANWALTMFLLASLYALGQRVATLEERTKFFHGELSAREAQIEAKK